MRQTLPLLTIMFLFSCGQQLDRKVNIADNLSDSISVNLSADPYELQIDLSKTTPLHFLKRIKINTDYIKPNVRTNPSPYFAICNPVPTNWITKNDVSKLIPYLDSNNVSS
ncbi:MAG: hypothetical protein HY840_11570 [Bacteroidetes bacterium]|nr:hypothetical protein [Bacteroidota bacterium]